MSLCCALTLTQLTSQGCSSHITRCELDALKVTGMRGAFFTPLVGCVPFRSAMPLSLPLHNREQFGHIPNVRSPLIAEGLFPVLCMASVHLLTFQWSQPATTTRSTKQTAGGRNQHIGRGCGPIAKPSIWGQESDHLNTRPTTFTSVGRDFSPLGE